MRTKLFGATNVSVTGPYMRQFVWMKDDYYRLFVLLQHFIGDDVVNSVKDKAYGKIESYRYRGDFLRFNYEQYTLVFEKNL